MTKPQNTGKFRWEAHIASICALGAAVLFLMHSDAAAEGVRTGLFLCGNVVVPSLFPFMVLSLFFCESPVNAVLARIFSPLTSLLRFPRAAGAILLAAAVGGYPTAAKCTAEAVRDGRVSSRDGERLLCSCVNAGPPFLIATVGAGVLGSVPLGVLLYVSQMLSALLIGLILSLRRPHTKPEEFSPPPPDPARVSWGGCLTRSVALAAETAFRMCAFILFFSALLGLWNRSPLPARLLEALLSFGNGSIQTEILWRAALDGFWEVTTGCFALRGLSGWEPVLVAAGLCSFSSVSVFFQVAGAVEGAPLSLKGFLLSRLPHALLTAGLCRFFLACFPRAVPSFAASGAPMELVSSASVPAVVSLLCMLSLFLLSLFPKDPQEL